MRAFGLGIVLFAVAMQATALAQTTSPPTRQPAPRQEDTRADPPKNNDFLWPALKLLQEAKRHADEEARRKKEREAQTPVAEPPAAIEPVPVTVTPPAVEPATTRLVLRKPKIPERATPVIVAVVPKTKPDLPAVLDPSIASDAVAEPQPMQPQTTVADTPAADVPPTPQTPASAKANTPWAIGLPVIAAGLLLLLAAAAYSARQFLGFAAPLPYAKARVDAGVTSAPQFDEVLPSIALMIGAGAFTTASDYPQSQSAT